DQRGFQAGGGQHADWGSWIRAVGGSLQTAAVSIPLVWPRGGASGRGLIAALHDVHNKAQNVPTAPDDPITAYVHWATASVTALRPWLGRDDVDRLVRTATYWAALTMPTGTMQGARLVGEEMTARREELQRVLTSLEQF